MDELESRGILPGGKWLSQIVQYQVFVDDHFHYRDESERYLDATFPTYDEAVERCRAIVDADLENALKPGMTAEKLFELYSLFGPDPFVLAEPRQKIDPPFSAWEYAQARSKILASTSAASLG